MKLKIIGNSVLAGSLVVGFPALAGASASHASPTRSVGMAEKPSAQKLTLLQKGLQFYRGKTITLLCPVGTGDVYDVQDRALASVLSTYLKATVNVLDIHVGGTVGGANYMAAQAPNGLIFGNVITQSYMQDLVASTHLFKFNIRELVDLGTTPTGAYALASAPNSIFKKMSDVLASKTAANNKVITTTTPLEDDIAFNALAIPHADLPEGSVGPDITGFLRGDSPLIGVSLGGLEPLIKAGQARPLLLWGSTKYPRSLIPYLKGVPTLDQEAKKLKIHGAALQAIKADDLIQGFQMFFMAPQGTPPAEVAALEAGLNIGLNSGPVRTTNVVTGLGPGYVSPRQANKNLTTLLGLVAQINAYQGPSR